MSQAGVLLELERIPSPRPDQKSGDASTGEADPLLTLQLADRKNKRSSAFRGVTPHGKRWKARLKWQKKVVFYQRYDTEEEAARGYDKALVKFLPVKKRRYNFCPDTGRRLVNKAYCKYKGVSKLKKPNGGMLFQAYVTVSGTLKFLGRFKTAEDAACRGRGAPL